MIFPSIEQVGAGVCPVCVLYLVGLYDPLELEEMRELLLLISAILLADIRLT